MAKTVFLHLGANKTGSSAIQEFLRLNAERLIRHGIFVATSDLTAEGKITGQQAPFIESLLADVESGSKTIAGRVAARLQGLPDGAKLILSAENLSNPGNGSPQLFSGVVAKEEVRLLFYIRRQDEYLLSSWRQWYSKESDDFWAWIVAAAGRRCDWRTIIQAWERVIPCQQISVRVYDRKQLHEGDIIADFLQAIGLSGHLAEFEIPKGNINPSYSEAVQDLVKANPLLFRNIHDDDTFRMIDMLTGNAFHRRSRESAITHEQRLALFHKYDDGNNWVRNHYFPEMPGPLFIAPQPGDYDYVDPIRVEREKWDVVMALLSGLSTKVLR